MENPVVKWCVKTLILRKGLHQILVLCTLQQQSKYVKSWPRKEKLPRHSVYHTYLYYTKVPPAIYYKWSSPTFIMVVSMKNVLMPGCNFRHILRGTCHGVNSPSPPQNHHHHVPSFWSTRTVKTGSAAYFLWKSVHRNVSRLWDTFSHLPQVFIIVFHMQNFSIVPPTFIIRYEWKRSWSRKKGVLYFQSWLSFKSSTYIYRSPPK